MATIEERVVGMRFDSSKFQSGIKVAVDGLDRLKTSLKLTGATKAIDELDNAGKRFSLGNVGAAAEGVSLKFAALATIGITALSNIVTKAMDAGGRILKSLTIDPVKAGLAEYELKMGSIQTILANTSKYGTKLPQVVGALDELNTYADKTIYNFGEMTKSIGLFTNAGIKLEDATSMIKGFSNSAAASGTTAEAAARASVQLSQALSAGTIRAMDWFSLTNAGMGNKNMQDGLIDIASAMGQFNSGTTSAEEAGKNFKGSLEKEWLSADVMSSYLKIMAGDMDATAMSSLGLSDAQVKNFKAQQKTAEEAATKVRTYTQLLGTMQEAVGSGWSESFDIIIGDFDEATTLFTNVNNTLGGMIGDMADARNKILTDWDKNGGRTAAIDAISKAFGFLQIVMSPIIDAFKEIFPPTTGKQLADITKNINNFFQGLKLGTQQFVDLKSTAKGLFALLDIGRMIIMGVVGMIMDLFGASGEAAGGILGFTGNIGDFIVKLRDAIKNGDGLSMFFGKLGGVIKFLMGIIGSAVGVLADFFGGLTKISSAGVEGYADKVEARFKSFGDFFGTIGRLMSDFGKKIVEVAGIFEPFVSRIGELASGLGAAIKDSFKTGDFNAVIDFINTGFLGAIGVLIFKFVKHIKGTLSKVSPGGGIKDAIKGVFGELGNTLKTLQTQVKAKALLLIAGAVALLTLSVVALSLIDPAKLAIALGAITVMFGQLGAVMVAFDKIFANSSMADAGKMVLLSAAMIGIATAMLLFSGAIAILGSMSPEQLVKGLVGLAGALAIVTGALLLMSYVGPGAILGAAALVIASAGIVLLAGALKLMGMLNWDEIGKAMTVLGSSLAILAVGLTLMAGSIPGAAALLIASVGLTILGGALKIFASMDPDAIGRAMATLGYSLGLLALGLTLMIASGPGALALVVASVGLAAIAGVLKIFATMDWDAIGRAMAVLGYTLGILAVGLTLMIVAMPGAAALVVAAAALAILAPVLLLLGTMTWDQIGTGLGAVALALGLLAVAGVLILPAIPGLLGLGVAVVLLGAGLLLAGVGVAALGVGLTALAVAGGSAVLVLTAAITSIAALIPFVLQQIGLGLIEIIKIIGQNGPAILVAITTVLMALIGAIIKVIPAAVAAIVSLVKSLVKALVVLIPLLVTAGMKLIIGILDGVAKNIGKVVEKGADIIVNFIKGLSKALPRLLRAGADLIIDLINGLANTIRSRTAEINKAGRNLAGAIVDGMTSGLRNAGSMIWNAAKALVSHIPDAIKKVLGIASPSKVTTLLGWFTGKGVAVGLDSTGNMVGKSASKVGDTAINALKKSMSNAGEFMSLSMDASPTIRPVLDLSGVKKSAGQISKIVGNHTLAVDGATARANEIAYKYGEYQQSKVESYRPTTEVSMVQNNFSPKALPATEIYRQSKNQMSILKGELEKLV